MEEPVEITVLLERARAGDETAQAEILPRLYHELRAIAAAKMQNARPDHTLQPTALVHEAYLRALGEDSSFDSRAHFFFIAARAMRDILVEHARKHASQKRGGDRHFVSTEQLAIAVEAPAEDMLALNEALQRLERAHPRQHQLVMLRFFAGLTAKEAAELLQITERTAERDWRFAKAYLHSLLVRTAQEQ